jgi:hypothetical protein
MGKARALCHRVRSGASRQRHSRRQMRSFSDARKDAVNLVYRLSTNPNATQALMTDPKTDKPNKAAAQKARIAKERADRLNTALRANLLKRKAQSRARDEPSQACDTPDKR